MTVTADAVLCIMFVLCACVCNGDLKLTCDRDCDFVQVYLDRVGTDAVTMGMEWGWGQ